MQFGRRRFLTSSSNWITVVGLEIHAQIASKLKLFSLSLNNHDARMNSLVAPFDIAVPGYLPVLNEECLDLALRAAILLDCKVRSQFTFDRKHYSYPDLPHGYQITQYYEPYAENGRVHLDDHQKDIPVDRIQIEMDSGRAVDIDGQMTVDMNRAGIGLLEFVTPPVMRSAAEAVSFARKLHQLLRHAQVCLCGLESGQFRIDVNVSVTGPQAPAEAGPLGTRVEIKNLNSFASLAQVIESEANRHMKILEAGKLIKRETRGFDAMKGATFPLRSKEEGHDYRFIRDFDIPIINLSEGRLTNIRKAMPRSIDELRNELLEKYRLSQEQISALLSNSHSLDLFTAVMNRAPALQPSLVCHVLFIDLTAALNNLRLNPSATGIDLNGLVALIQLLGTQQLPRNKVRLVLESWIPDQLKDIRSVVQSLGILVTSIKTDQIATLCKEALEKEMNKTMEVVNGSRSIDYFMGPIVKSLNGKALPQEIRKVLQTVLSEYGKQLQ